MFSSFRVTHRLTGRVGPRGTGKTTLLLQYIKEKLSDRDHCIYASLDNMYFARESLLSFVSEVLKAREKIYLDNTNLYAAIASQSGDFEVDGTVYEIGGRNKRLKQIKTDLDHGFVAKDDTLHGSTYEIPLHMFGVLY